MSQIPFSDLGLRPAMERAVKAMGFETATDIQSEAIPPIRAGQDVVARSQTGTGKTIAFAIPAIECIATDELTPTVQVLLLCPTRELAQQAGHEIRSLARYLPDIRPVEIFGGAAIDRQCIRLRRANLVVGTPGRVMDHMRRKTLKLDHVKMVILDEADEMLNMGFKEDIETILRGVPQERQTVLFSATMPPAILALTKEFQRSPQVIEIDKDHATLEGIEQKYFEVPHSAKKEALLALMKSHKEARSIIFCNTKKMVDEITQELQTHGFSVESIHSDIRQSRRTSVMLAFKRSKISTLVATDIAARGIDARDVDYVINYDIPQNPEYYIHRIGRTGRAGKSGCSITICGGRRETAIVRGIVAGIGSKLSQMQPPIHVDAQIDRQEPSQGLLKQAVRKKPSWAEREPERAPTVAKKACPAYETIAIGIGKNQEAKKNLILYTIIEHTALTAADIGKIQIFPERTVVEVPASSVEQTVRALTGCTICGRPAKVEKLAGAPTPYQRPQSRAPHSARPFQKTRKATRSHNGYKEKK